MLRSVAGVYSESICSKTPIPNGFDSVVAAAEEESVFAEEEITLIRVTIARAAAPQNPLESPGVFPVNKET